MAALLLFAPVSARGAEPAGGAPSGADATVASERLVPEEEWAGDLVDALALDHALPESPRPADLFSLLCAEQLERGVVDGGHDALVGPVFEASAEIPPARRPGDPARVVLHAPGTALYMLAVEGVGRQRWVIDQRPVGHLDPTPMGVTWSAAAVPLRAGPHELTGFYGREARAVRVSLHAARSLCVAPADGWHAQRPLTQGARARTLVRAFGLERRLPDAGDPIEIEGEAYETVSAGGGRTNRRVAVAASRGVWATASASPAELVWRLVLEEPAVVTLEARVLGDATQLWSVDERYRAAVTPGAGRDAFAWEHVMTVPLGSGAHELRARVPRHAGVDLLRATPRRSHDADYLAVLRGLGLRVSAPEAVVTRSDALASLSSPVFLELANAFQRRVEGDTREQSVVLIDETPEPRAAARPLSPLLPSEL
jgi:hypothetical protein